MTRRGFFAALLGLLVTPTVASSQQWQGPAGMKLQKQGGKWYIRGNRHRIEDVEWAVRYIDQDLALAERRPVIVIDGIEIVYGKQS
jgi:hypothetical protein